MFYLVLYGDDTALLFACKEGNDLLEIFTYYGQKILTLERTEGKLKEVSES